MAHEFDLIERYFKPLAAGFAGSLALSDDAALIEVPAGMQLVVTKDAISEGIHFIGNEEPALIAQKLLRTNLSDLAAMGAEPHCYFLSLSFPRKRESNLSLEHWLDSFTSGLAKDQQLFGIHLAGGDTTSSRSDLTLSITALGLVPRGAAIKRSGAKPGDAIYVSGTLGDSALGLMSLRGATGDAAIQNIESWIASAAPRNDIQYLISRYLLPQPRLELGMKLRGVATNCMDISDGLVQDLGHICKASGVGAVIHADKIPLSDAARKQPDHLNAALTGGDDYELLFTSSQDFGKLNLPCPITRIGEITNSRGVVVLDNLGVEKKIDNAGYQHF